MEARFIVPGKPVGKGRPRFNRSTGRAYTPKGTADYEANVRYAWLNHGCQKLDGPLRCTIEAVFGVPESYTNKKTAACLAGEIMPTGKPDCDNIAKAILDALNDLAFHDDSQVVDVIVRKRYGRASFVDVHLEEIDAGGNH